MTDLFISYATEDRPQAKLLAEALAEQGWSVWWDRTMPTGSRYHQVIEEALRGARCVVVLWTANSVGSDWVRAEAGEGLARSVLVPVSLDDAPPPLVFRQIQTADLRGWAGDASAPPFRTLVSDIATLLSSPPAAGGGERKQASTRAPQESSAAPRQRQEERRRTSWPWIALATVFVLALGVGLATRSRWLDGPEPKPAVTEPEIGLLEVVPPRIPAGGRAQLRWRTAHATAVEISGLGSVAMAGERSVAPPATTVFTLIARDHEGRTVEREVQLVVEVAPPPPQILRFEAAPSRVRAGESSDLRWETSGADEVRIGDLGTVKASGTLRVSPKETTSYTLVATSGTGSTRREAVVEVAPVLSGPEIVSFTADPTTVRAGARVELVWQTTNAERVKINDDSVRPSGKMTYHPKETTTYALTAINSAGATATRRLRVLVEEPAREEPARMGGKLEIAEGKGVDLDSGTVGGDRAEWDVSFAAKVPSARFLYPNNGALIAPVRAGTLKTGPQGCMNVKLSRYAIAIERIERGSEFCVRTSRGRVAGLAALDSVGPSPGVLQLSYRIWQSP